MIEIRSIKLITGEEILCEMDMTVPTLLKNPVQMRMVPSMSGQAQIALLPFPISSDQKEIPISSAHIVYNVTPTQDFIDQYKQIFSGIVTPSQSLIL